MFQSKLNKNSCQPIYQTALRGSVLITFPKKISTPEPLNLVSILSLIFKINGLKNTRP